MKKLLPKLFKQNIAIDLDGTILDSSKRHLILLDKILSNLDIKINTKDYLKYKSQGFNTEKYLLSKNIETTKVSLICKEWIKHIENLELLKTDKLYKDSIPFLINIYKKYNLILITSRSNKKNTKNQINDLNIKKYFKKIIIVKPNNNMVNKTKITKKYNCIAIIGDTEIEKQVSDNLKINIYPLNRGFRSKEYWNKTNIVSYSSLKSIKI